MTYDEQKDPVAWSMLPTISTANSSERDNKETLFVKEEVTNDAEVSLFFRLWPTSVDPWF